MGCPRRRDPPGNRLAPERGTEGRRRTRDIAACEPLCCVPTPQSAQGRRASRGAGGWHAPHLPPQRNRGSGPARPARHLLGSSAERLPRTRPRIAEEEESSCPLTLLSAAISSWMRRSMTPLPPSSIGSATSSLQSTTCLVPTSPKRDSSRRSEVTSTIERRTEPNADGHAVLAYEPPDRVVFSWDIGPQWQIEADKSNASEVEVRFVAESPERTRVELEHRRLDRHGPGWESLRDGVDSDGGWPLYLARYSEVIQGD